MQDRYRDPEKADSRKTDAHSHKIGVKKKERSVGAVDLIQVCIQDLSICVPLAASQSRTLVQLVLNFVEQLGVFVLQRLRTSIPILPVPIYIRFRKGRVLYSCLVCERDGF